MREILFRGKRVDTGEWVYGYLCDCFDFKGVYHPAIQEFECAPKYEVNPETVGQYTGLAADSKKIFEGDIVTYAEDGIRGGFSQGVMEIVWNEKTAGFCGRTAQGRLVEIIHLKNVIGNIYDNPELLEVEK